jgi:hypothetical protein
MTLNLRNRETHALLDLPLEAIIFEPRGAPPTAVVSLPSGGPP